MIQSICKRLNFPDEATEYFCDIYERITRDETLSNRLSAAREDYFLPDGLRHEDILAEISEKMGVHVYSVHMVFLLFCVQPLRQRYAEKGISEEIFYDTMNDLRYKLDECKKLYDIWGTFVFFWFRGFFLCERFKLGRLQFERIPFAYDNYKGILRKGDTVYNCHIPSAGPLTEESVMESLGRAYSFFRDELKGGILPVYCSSWLLYPPTADRYPEGSNLKKFYRMFDLVTTAEKPDNPDFWRVFYKEFSPEVLNSVVPTTSLQRIFAEHLKAGNCMGSGKGIILFDGEKTVK